MAVGNSQQNSTKPNGTALGLFLRFSVLIGTAAMVYMFILHSRAVIPFSLTLLIFVTVTAVSLLIMKRKSTGVKITNLIIASALVFACPVVCGLLLLNDSFSTESAQDITVSVLSTGKHASRHKSYVTATVNIMGKEKELEFIDDGTNSEYHHVRLTIRKGLLGYYVVVKSQLVI
jgi:hypothetical protein